MEETRRKRSSKQHEPVSRDELIVARWNALSCPAVGAQELSAIQAELNKQLGSSAVNSPAAIARVLADAGAKLRHPEVIECDALWRAEQIPEAPQSSELFEVALNLTQAEALIEELERRRIKADPSEAQGIRAIAIEARETAQRHSRGRSLDQLQKSEQQEIAEWLGVWIKTPSLFRDWLELRRRSPEFRGKFPTESQ
jgi:hypothetical protein